VRICIEGTLRMAIADAERPVNWRKVQRIGSSMYVMLFVYEGTGIHQGIYHI
jgi:hypothetical protein